MCRDGDVSHCECRLKQTTVFLRIIISLSILWHTHAACHCIAPGLVVIHCMLPAFGLMRRSSASCMCMWASCLSNSATALPFSSYAASPGSCWCVLLSLSMHVFQAFCLYRPAGMGLGCANLYAHASCSTWTQQHCAEHAQMVRRAC